MKLRIWTGFTLLLFLSRISPCEEPVPNITGLNEVLQIFVDDGMAVNGNDVKSKLGIVNDYYQEPSLDDIAQCLQNYGYKVLVPATKPISYDFLNSLQKGDRTLMQIKDPWVGLDYGLISRSQNAFLFKRYPQPPQKVDFLKMKAELEQYGMGLLIVSRDLNRKVEGFLPYKEASLVTQNTTPAPIDPNTTATKWQQGSSLRIPSVLDVGVLTQNSPLISAILPVSNFGNEPIEISDIKGTCSCFKGATFPRTIRPGKSDNIRLTFDISGYRNLQQFRTGVLVVTSDSGLPHNLIPIVGKFDNDLNVFLLPKQLDLGRVFVGSGDRISILTRRANRSVLIKDIVYDKSIFDIESLRPDNISRGELHEVAQYTIRFIGRSTIPGIYESDVIFNLIVNNQPVQISQEIHFFKNN